MRAWTAMAASPTPRPTPSADRLTTEAGSNPCQPALLDWCRRWPLKPQACVAVAYSAGADSAALLCAAQSLWPGRVTALHVHHGLQAAADGFEATARELCQRLELPLLLAHVSALPAPGQSPEDAARIHRYAALARLAGSVGADVVLLAQHADDQAETVLLALSRGAGLPGLAAMPERFERHGVCFGRPLLGLAGVLLRNWLQASGTSFVDDPSNADLRYTRNRIRAELLPAWQNAFPGFRPMLARTARHAAQAQELLDELARIDLLHTGQPPAIVALQSLSPQRQANALRLWLRSQWGVVPSEAQMQALLCQVDACRTRGHRMQLRVAGGTLVRDGACLAFSGPDNRSPI